MQRRKFLATSTAAAATMATTIAATSLPASATPTKSASAKKSFAVKAGKYRFNEPILGEIQKRTTSERLAQHCYGSELLRLPTYGTGF